MAFIISKKSTTKGEERLLYYLVENYRDNDKVKRRKLLALGDCKNVPEFLERMERRQVGILNRLEMNENRLKNFLATGKNPFPFASLTDTQENINYRLVESIERTKIELQEHQIRKERIKSFL